MPLLFLLLTLAAHTSAGPDGPIVPVWAELIEAEPSARLVRNSDLRKRIQQSGYAWRVRDRATGIEMLLVPAGTYMRGASPEIDRPPTEELPRHAVTISTPYYLGRYEVQEKEWDFLFDGVLQPKPLGPPVVGRRYEDVEAFLRRANAARPAGANPMRAPTEGEWEYACRAGTLTAHYGKSLAKVAWYVANASKRLHAVGEREPNDLGFSDMLGNAVEWCSDFFDPAEYESVVQEAGECVDPVGSPHRSKGQVLRGGGIHHDAHGVTASARMRAFAGAETRPYGFRVASHP